MHRLLRKQIGKASGQDGTLDVEKFLQLVDAYYDDQDRDRERTERSMSLMIEEIEANTRDLEARVALRTSELEVREAELRTKNLLFDAALSNMSQGLAMFDADLRLLMHNERYAWMFGVQGGETWAGMSLRELLYAWTRKPVFSGDAERYVEDALSYFGEQSLGTQHRDLGDGRIIAVNVRKMTNGGWVVTYEDITDRKIAEARITYLARHDPLTGLANRTLLVERLESSLAHVRRGEQLAVLCLDLDRFKSINDTLGHPVGDELLRQTAQRLESCVRETDTVARIGGDEFTIIQTNIPGPMEAEKLAVRIAEALASPFEIQGHSILAGISIGIAVAPADGLESEELFKHSDMALYGAKSEGRGAFRFFEPGMNARMRARRRLEVELQHAIAEEQFQLHYQPIVNLESDAVGSFEALLRWRHPERGLVSPLEFIPVAEDIRLIIPLGEWVIRRACLDATRFPNEIGVSVNISPTQLLSKTLIPTVILALRDSGLRPQRLEFEITEAVFMRDSHLTLEVLHQLRGLGISIAMDDFGTGYSSLSYLRSFPFDRIKIDRSFICSLGESAESTAIVKAVVGLAGDLCMSTTAEGVETQSQLENVRRLGCHNVQGYYFARPTPVDALEFKYDRAARIEAAA